MKVISRITFFSGRPDKYFFPKWKKRIPTSIYWVTLVDILVFSCSFYRKYEQLNSEMSVCISRMPLTSFCLTQSPPSLHQSTNPRVNSIFSQFLVSHMLGYFVTESYNYDSCRKNSCRFTMLRLQCCTGNYSYNESVCMSLRFVVCATGSGIPCSIRWSLDPTIKKVYRGAPCRPHQENSKAGNYDFVAAR